MKQKRFMSLLLALCTLFTLVPFSAFAEETTPADNATIYLRGKDGYQTNPVPQGQPIPVNPEDTKVTDKVITLGNDIGGGAWQKDE